MPPPPNERRPGSQSNPQIDPTNYQLLYEFERRLDDKLTAFREQASQDTERIVSAAVAPLTIKIAQFEAMVTARMSEGERRFGDHDRRFKDHSDRIDAKSTPSRALVAVEAGAPDPAATAAGGGWIRVDRIPTIFFALATLASTIFAGIAMWRSGGAVPPAPPSQPTATQPTSP